MQAISGTLAALALAAGGCATRPATLPTEPNVTLAVHRDADVLVVDRLPDGATGRLVPRGRFHAENAPDLTLEVRGERQAALWMVGASRVIVREAPSTTAPRIGEVLSSWDGRAIRLTMFGRDGSALRTDVFQRVDNERGAPVLARDEPGARDLGGTYRATVRDAHDADVGWMRVQIRPAERMSRIYDAMLPPTVNAALAASATVALDEEIRWLEEH